MGGAGQTGRPRTDQRHALSIGRTRLKKLCARSNDRVHGIALQSADIHRPAALLVEDARPFAEHRSRAGPGTTLPQDVRAQNGPGRAAQVAGRNLPDELRHVDLRRTGLDAGRIMAEQTTRPLFQGLRRGQRRIDVGKVLFELIERKRWSGFLEHGCLAMPAYLTLWWTQQSAWQHSRSFCEKGFTAKVAKDAKKGRKVRYNPCISFASFAVNAFF